MISELVANTIWSMLVEDCGARKDDIDRHEFVAYLMSEERGEWRFIGNLGFGGKFYFSPFEFRIGCYKEDTTEEKTLLIEETNQKLEPIFQQVYGGF